MKKTLFSFRECLLLSIVLTIVVCTGCEEKENPRYALPPWLGGSNIETLEEWTALSNGNKDSSYAHFLDLMRVAEYTNSIENSLFTLFPPSDRAFEEYFEKIGIDSAGDLGQPEAERIFTLHLQRNPLTRYYLVYTYKFDLVQDDEGEYGPLFFRQLTRSEPPTYIDSVRYYEKYLGENLYVYGEDKYICLFSSELMTALSGAPDGSDYEFICRDTKWSKSGLNWHNAEILKAEHPTSNGYIYTVDRVIEPPPSVDKHLRDYPAKFGLFYNLLQRFAKYSGRRLDINGYEKYKKSYTDLIYDLSNEQGPNADHLKEKDIYTAFVPTNDVLQEYLDNTFLKSFENIDSIPDASIIYLLKSHISRNLQLASKMDRFFLNNYGDEIDLDPYTEITDGFLCSNGVVYTLNRTLAPNAFNLVPGPLFFNTDYSTFLNILLVSESIPQLSQTEVSATVFAPSNAALLDAGIRYNNEELEVQIIREDGKWDAMTALELEEYVNNHISFRADPGFAGEGFFQLASGNYVKYASEALEAGGNREDEDIANISGTEDSEQNGILYLLDTELKAPVNTKAMFIMNDPDLSQFTELLENEGLISTYTDPETEEEVSILILPGQSEEWTAFIPTNDAMSANPIPVWIDTTAFLKYHFVQNRTIFDDGVISGDFPTAHIQEQTEDVITYATLNINNQPENLVLTDVGGQTITVDHASANYIVQHGVIHKIDTQLKFY